MENSSHKGDPADSSTKINTPLANNQVLLAE